MLPALGDEAASPDAAGRGDPLAIRLAPRLATGFNLPDWDKEGRPGRNATLEALAAAGMRHIRLPVDDAPLLGADTSRADVYCDALIGQIAELNALGYTVSIDLHPGGPIAAAYRGDPQTAEKLVLAAWDQLAAVVRLFPPQAVLAELLNEPPVTGALWQTQLPRLAAALRARLPGHTLVLSPAGPQRHEALAAMTPMDDPNVIYAVHYYDPFVFTHQGATWDGPQSTLPDFAGLPFPAAAGDPAIRARIADLEARGRIRAVEVLEAALADGWTAAKIDADFALMAAWSRRFRRPVIVNEFGVYADRAPRAARLAWLAAVAHAATKNGIGWTHWDYDAGFGLVDPETGRPDAAVLAALLPGRAEAE